MEITKEEQVDEETKEDHHELREKLLRRTIELVKSEGPDALSLRGLADDCNTSTQMIYTIFGGKQELLEELYETIARQLDERCESIPDTSDPIERLAELSRVYRKFALEHRELYDSMFRNDIDGEPFVQRTRVFDVFKEAVDRCIQAGILPTVDAEELTDSLWAAAHGAVSLEISGYYDSEKQARSRYGSVIDAVFEGFRGSS